MCYFAFSLKNIRATTLRPSGVLRPRQGLPKSLTLFVLILIALTLTSPLSSSASDEQAPATLYITMHTAPIDDYCAPCIASEKLLKEAQLEFRKVLEPLGPWPWFMLTNEKGQQRKVTGALNADDIARIKRGEWPVR